MHENNPDLAFWFEFSQEQRDLLDRSARNSIPQSAQLSVLERGDCR